MKKVAFVGLIATLLVSLIACSDPFLATDIEAPAISAKGSGAVHTISMSTSTPGAPIHYTTNGAQPCMITKLYESPFTIEVLSESLTINAIAIDNLLHSPVSSTTVRFVGPALNLSGKVTTLVAASAASVSSSYVTTDGAKLYTPDGYQKIRVIDIATGTVSISTYTNENRTETVLSSGTGITTDGTYYYITHYNLNVIDKISISTGIATMIGNSSMRGGYKDGASADAKFRMPTAITTDGTNLYVADSSNAVIRKIEIASGVVSTLAGNGAGGYIDGTGTGAAFSWPIGIATDGSNLYIADNGNHAIRKIVINTGVVTTLADYSTFGKMGGIGTAASSFWPVGITTDGSNLYITSEWGREIYKFAIATGVGTILAGSQADGHAGHADGTGAEASFQYPSDITTDGDYLYVMDSNGIRKIQ